MSAIYLRESDVDELIDMRGSIAALERAFVAQAADEAQNSPRTRARYWGSRLNIMSAGARTGRFGFKAYAGTRAPTVYHVMLYDADLGLVAIIEARRLSRLRTGAATGVATDRLATPGAIALGMIGAGDQAHTQIAAVAAVRPLREALVFARNTQALHAFCEESSRALGVEVKPAKSAQACVANADVVIAATDSQTPVIRDEWLQPSAHVNTIGANAANRMELELDTFTRAACVVTDDVDQARIEAGELIQCVERGSLKWEDVTPLARIVAERRTLTGGLTIFKSLGAAIEDLAVASAVYDLALAQGRGQVL